MRENEPYIEPQNRPEKQIEISNYQLFMIISFLIIFGLGPYSIVIALTPTEKELQIHEMIGEKVLVGNDTLRIVSHQNNYKRRVEGFVLNNDMVIPFHSIHKYRIPHKFPDNVPRATDNGFTDILTPQCE